MARWARSSAGIDPTGGAEAGLGADEAVGAGDAACADGALEVDVEAGGIVGDGCPQPTTLATTTSPTVRRLGRVVTIIDPSYGWHRALVPDAARLDG
jgi:hypothetical protein